MNVTKESKVAVVDIVPVPGEWFGQTLTAASPGLLREMIRAFAQKMMDAEAEVACGAGCGEVSPSRVNSRNGCRQREWDTRVGTAGLAAPEAAARVVLPLVPGAPPPGRAGAGLSRGHVLPAGRID